MYSTLKIYEYSIIFCKDLVKPTLNTYYITNLSSNLCATSSANSSILVGIPIINLNISPNGNPVCDGASVTLTASHNGISSSNAPASYRWERSINGGSTWSVITGAISPIYTMTSVTKIGRAHV